MARCAALLLLLLFWAGALRGAQEGPPSADLSGLSGTLKLLWSGIGRIVRLAVEPPIAGLDGRLTGVQVQLNSVSSELEARVESAETKLKDRVESAETKLEARVESAQKQLEARMDSIQSEQAGQLSQIESALQGVQSQLEFRLEGVQSQLESRLEEVQSQQRPVRDCSDLPAGAASGVHLLQPGGLTQLVPAFCDQQTDGGGWTIIQRRADIQPRQDFFVGWEAYKWGFGALDSEFWWGLQNMWLTTSPLDRRYQIRIDMEDFDGEKRFALYQGFRVASEEDGYRLTVVNYTGNAGDSLGSHHSGQRFSTKDRDQDAHDTRHCAEEYKGSWWYQRCHHSNLNGLYLSGNHSSNADGINWYHWRGAHYSLKSVEMKIKPSKKL